MLSEFVLPPLLVYLSLGPTGVLLGIGPRCHTHLRRPLGSQQGLAWGPAFPSFPGVRVQLHLTGLRLLGFPPLIAAS